MVYSPICLLEPRQREVMKDDTWKNVDDSVYSPTTMKLGILHALQSASHRNKSIHNLDVFINNLIYERKQIVLDENGMSLSKSVYIPYEILPTEILAAMNIAGRQHRATLFFHPGRGTKCEFQPNFCGGPFTFEEINTFHIN